MSDPFARRVQRLCDKSARQLGREGQGGFAGLWLPGPDGEVAFGWSATNVNQGDLLGAALAILKAVEAQAAEGAMTCEGCAATLERVQATIAALTGAQEAAGRNLH